MVSTNRMGQIFDSCTNWNLNTILIIPNIIIPKTKFNPDYIIENLGSASE